MDVSNVIMKHTLKIIVILVLLFLLTQLIGLFVTNKYVGVKGEYEGQKLPYNIERPEFEEQTSFIPIFAIILLATALALLLAKFRMEKLWKVWFFIAVWFCLMIALAVFVSENLAFFLAFISAMFKVFKRNIIVHNITELFIYGGLAAIFVPILNIFSISILLILISVYDMIAVWKTKHMVKLAKFQTNLKLFAGFLIPYGKDKAAVLGGGDIGFPLMFAGVVMMNVGLKALIIPLVTSLVLFVLLVKTKKNKFYPAMPFLSIGCFLGLALTYLI